MKYLIALFLILAQLHSASIDENYFDNEKVHKYIELQREKLNKIHSEDIKVINKITFQNLLLTKLSKLLNSPTDPQLPNIDKIEKEAVDEKMFIFYFNKLSEFYIDLEDLKIKKVKHLEIINSIKERLSNLNPEDISEIELSQMEYAYYKYKFEDIELLIKQYKKFNEKAIEKLSLIVQKTPFNKKNIDEKILELSDIVEENRKKATTIKLYTERSLINLLRSTKEGELSIIDDVKLSDDILNDPKAKTYKANLKNLKDATNRLVVSINEKLNYIILAQFYNFEQDDMDAYREFDAIIKRDSAELDEQSLRQLKEKEKILNWFINKYLGYFGAIAYDTSLWVDKFVDATSTITSKTLYISNDKSVTLVDIFWMIIIVIIGFLVGNLYRNRVLKLRGKYRSNSSIQTLKILANFGYYIIVLLFLVSAIKRIGLDLSSLSIIVGALSVGIGFGLKELISNFVSGIILMFERAIKIGDFIEVSSEMQGVVTDIRMRATTIKTIGNVDVIVPNSKIIQNAMINHTMEDTRRRLIVPFSVGYDTAHERVEELVLNALVNSEFNYIKDEDKKPIVTIANLAKDGVDYKLLAWVHEDKVVGKSNYYKLILKTLRDAGINIAHQQVDLHVVKEKML